MSRITAQGVRFRNYHKTDELTAFMRIPWSKLPVAQTAAKKAMCTMETVQISGTVPSLKGMKTRLLVPGLLALLICIVFLLQGHIWFFKVAGNEYIPEEKIIRALEECGVGFFSKSDELDLNLLKNQMLTKLPELGWITVNIQGGVAQVVVRPRAEKPETAESAAPANIVAEKNGLITNVVTTGGTAAVKPGDLVSEGQLLISGVTNLDKTLLLTRAEGEVYARTWASLQGISPKKIRKKVYTGEEKTIISVTCGKKTVKISKTSGISYGDYDKISLRKPLTLPGGYTLPISLTVTTLREYRLEDQLLSKEDASGLLEQATLRNLRQSLTAGKLLSRDFSVEQTQQVYALKGTAECQEEIGRVDEIKD